MSSLGASPKPPAHHNLSYRRFCKRENSIHTQGRDFFSGVGIELI